MRSIGTILALALLLGGAQRTALAQKQEDPPKKPRPRVIKLGGLKIHHTHRFLEINAQISLNRGLVELFGCTKSGKAYESVVVLDCQPVHLMTGLMLLRLKKGHGGRFQGDSVKPTGSKVRILCTWTDPKTRKTRRFYAEDMVWNHKARRAMKRTGWIFIGSRFVKNPNTGKEIFMAQYTGTVIVTYHDPDAILDTPSEAGDDDTTFYANHHLLPPRGTQIKLLIYPEDVYKKLPRSQQAEKLPELPKTGGLKKKNAGGGKK